MGRMGALVRKSVTPITIMIVPHSKSRFLRLKVPLLVIWCCLLVTLALAVHSGRSALNASRDRAAREKLEAKFSELDLSVTLIAQTGEEVRKVFTAAAPLPRRAVATNTGTIDMESMRRQVRQAVESIAEIKQYLNEQHDLFLATPAGLPVNGPISSPFGPRRHPGTGEMVLHHGIDISIPSGTPGRATADGIVSFSGWGGGSGNVLVLEHGYGFNTAYAHNSRNIVKVGQQVKRGQVVATSGATGVTTGPHMHYEVWKDGRQVDPVSLMNGR